ncbi:MAG: 2-amino-4-hydroxy-6-hydroxymethyldihydropteridine diphosphokinase [Hyphomicrobiaceae bacterium]
MSGEGRRERRAIVAVGANVAGRWGEPRRTVRAAEGALEAHGIRVLAHSRLFETEPVGPISQPPFVNGALLVATTLAPGRLLASLKEIEAEAGRVDGLRWGPRALDLDIVDYDGRVVGWERTHDPEKPRRLVLPHPEMHRRAFVLMPLADVAPDWRHPVFGLTAGELIARLEGGVGGMRAIEE